MTKGETTTLDIVGRANVYKARLSTDGAMSKVCLTFVELRCQTAM